MDGYTPWISDEAGEEEDVNGGAPVMRKGNQKTAAGEMTKSIPYMIMKKMPKRIV